MQKFVKRQQGETRQNALSTEEVQRLKLPVHTKLGGAFVTKGDGASTNGTTEAAASDQAKSSSDPPRGLHGQSQAGFGGSTARGRYRDYVEEGASRTSTTLSAGNHKAPGNIVRDPALTDQGALQRRTEEVAREGESFDDFDDFDSPDFNDMDQADAMMHDIISSMTESQRKRLNLTSHRVSLDRFRDDDARSYPTTTSGELQEEHQSQDGGTTIDQPPQATTTAPPTHSQPFAPLSFNTQQGRKHRDAYIAEANKSYQRNMQAQQQAETVSTSHVHAHSYVTGHEMTGDVAKQTQTLMLNSDIDANKSKTNKTSGRRYLDESDARDFAAWGLKRNAGTHTSQLRTQPHLVQEYSMMQDKPSLDYEKDELYNMSFADLRNEPFDRDPRGIPSAVPVDKVSAPLPERLEYMEKQNPDEQARFFASITGKEWEESGDWFMERFQALTAQLVRSRQERRKLAMDFENEIAQRQEEVSKASERLDDSLKEMREKGNLVIPRSSSRQP